MKLNIKNLKFNKITIFIISFSLVGTIIFAYSYAAEADPRASLPAVRSFGIFPGYGNENGLKKHEAIEKEMGRKIQNADAFGEISSEQGFRSSTWGLFVNKPNLFCTRNDITVNFSVPLNFGPGDNKLTPERLAQNRAGLQATARGERDDSYKLLGERLMSCGQKNAILRIASEMDIPWNAYSMIGNEDVFKDAFRHVVNVLRATPGNNFKIDYMGNGGFNQSYTTRTGQVTTRAEAAFPGAEYVDIIGIDIYNRQSWDKNKVKLDFTQAMAKKYGKPMSIPEWGLWVDETGDDPQFIQNMYDWMNTTPRTGPGALYYNAYFYNYVQSDLAKAPNSRALFNKLFGIPVSNPSIPGTSSSTPTTPTPPPPTTPKGDVITVSNSSQLNAAIAAVTGGETIELASGSYGDLTTGKDNKSYVTIKAALGANVSFNSIKLDNANNWILSGLKINPSSKIIAVDFSGSNLVLENSYIGVIANTSNWSAADWISKTQHGVRASGSNITIKNNTIANVDMGIIGSISSSLISGNTIDGFRGDGIQLNGNSNTSNTTIENNVIKNAYAVDDNHDDGIQFYTRGSDGSISTGVISDITIRGNKIIEYENPNRSHIGPLQGIGNFGGTYKDWLIEDNTVVTDNWHGISVYGADNVVVQHNTVVDIKSGGNIPWIKITKHENGTAPINSTVKNNIATGFTSDSAGVTESGNTKISFSEYDDYFVDFDNFDLRLKSGAPVQNVGARINSTTPAPVPEPVPPATSIDLPDVIIEAGSVKTIPANPVAGEEVKFSVVIKNIGTGATPEGVIHGVSFWVDGKNVAWSDTSKTSLKPGESRTLVTNGGPDGNATWTATAGNKTVEARWDDIRRMEESNRNNNTRSLSFTVVEQAPEPEPTPPANELPDVTIEAGSVKVNPISPIAGDEVQFSVTIKNIGTGPTPEGVIHGIGFFIDGKNVAWSDYSTNSLKPGESRTLVTNGGRDGNATWTATEGNITVEARWDDVKRMEESNENNNSLQTNFTVAAQGSTPTPPPAPTDNEAPTLTITSPVTNAVLSGTSIFEATAQDDIGVTKVEIYFNSSTKPSAIDVASPFRFRWDTAKVADGPYKVKMKAYDASGKTVEKTVSVTVKNTVDVEQPATEPSTPSQPTQPAPIQVKADANNDGRIDIFDLALVLINFNKPASSTNKGDINNDGVINIYDLILILNGWSR